MKLLADRGGVDYANRTPILAKTSNSTSSYTTALSIAGAGWLLFLHASRNNTNSNRIRLTVDGVVFDAAQFAYSIDTSGGYPRHSTGLFNIPIRFDSSLLVEHIYSSTNIIYALD